MSPSSTGSRLEPNGIRFRDSNGLARGWVVWVRSDEGHIQLEPRKRGTWCVMILLFQGDLDLTDQELVPFQLVLTGVTPKQVPMSASAPNL